MAIRRATPEDSAAIGQIRIRGWRAAYQDLLPSSVLDAMNDDAREPARRELLRSVPPRSSVWVVEHDGRVVGFAMSGPTRDLDADRRTTGEVSAIYLEPDVIGKGFGRALFARAVDDLSEMGYRRVSVWVLSTNVRGRRFYEAAGFVADGTEQVVELDGAVLHEVRYVRELPDPAAPAS